MKSKIIAIALFTFTAITVTLYPALKSNGAINTPPEIDPVVINLPPADLQNNERPQVEVVFVLDTTGSMSGLIQTAKEKIWSIASTMASAESAPEIKMGLVAYRDRGDQYVTKVVDLSSDLDTMYATLMDFQADGGGDTPESVNQALYDAVHNMSWSQNSQAYKVVFLVGDAPPHMDYQDDVKYPNTISAALQKDIVINSIQCGNHGITTPQWQQIALLGQGRFFQVEQAGSAVAITTPFDKKLAELSAKLDDTRVYYGDRETKAKLKKKQAATKKLHKNSSIESRARRATFNSSASGEANFLGENELVEDIASGRADLSTIDKDKLPEPMQSMAPAEQQALIEEKAEKRNLLKQEIKRLSQQRSKFIEKKSEDMPGLEDSLDNKIYSAVKEQAKQRGLNYSAPAPRY